MGESIFDRVKSAYYDRFRAKRAPGEAAPTKPAGTAGIQESAQPEIEIKPKTEVARNVFEPGTVATGRDFSGNETATQYELQRDISYGGFATVYEAEMTDQSGQAERVAVKVLNNTLVHNPEMIELMRREAALLQKLGTIPEVRDHIIPFKGLLNVKDQPAYAMEFLDPKEIPNLSEFMFSREHRAKYEAMSTQERLQFTLDALSTVAELVDFLAAGVEVVDPETGETTTVPIYHYDLKPGNFFYDIKRKKVMVGDFGISNVVTQKMRPSEQRAIHQGAKNVMTLEYVSPERALSGYAEGSRSEVFSLAIMFVEFVTREKMFPAEVISSGGEITRRLATLNQMVPVADFEFSKRKSFVTPEGKTPFLDLVTLLTNAGYTSEQISEVERVLGRAMDWQPSGRSHMEEGKVCRAFIMQLRSILLGEPLPDELNEDLAQQRAVEAEDEDVDDGSDILADLDDL